MGQVSRIETAMGSIAEDTRWMDATGQAALVARGDVSAVELVDGAITRIEATNEPLNAIALEWFDTVDGAARAVPRGLPFGGVPTLLKDLSVHEAGRVLTNGNRVLRAAQPISSFDSELTLRFRRAGLVTLGRSTTSEMGSLPVTETAAYGVTRNPWSTIHTPGGSSGGAAASVASGMVPVAHASDGGGSIRIPASCCGLVGLKPSQGRISMAPDRPESILPVEFVVTRSVRDTAALLDAVAGPAIGDSVIAPAPLRPFADEVGADPGRLRIGLLDHRPGGAPIHTDCVAAVAETAARLEGLGHDVEPAWPSSLDSRSFDQQFFVLWATSRAVSLARLGSMIGRALTEDEVEGHNWAMAQFAKVLDAVAYAEALMAVSDFRRSTLSWWAGGYDLLLTPTLAQPPVRIGAMEPPADNPLQAMVYAGDFTGFTGQFNLTGQPAISVPGCWNEAGLPIGIQLVAAYGREDVLLQVASQMETAFPWNDLHPVEAMSPRQPGDIAPGHPAV